MTKLQQLHSQLGQSPWLDNIRREWLLDGTLQSWIDRGVRGVTSNPTIFQKAMSQGTAYDEQFSELLKAGSSVPEAYWAMSVSDVEDTLELFRPVHRESGGEDGFVSLELAPEQARDTKASIEAARDFHTRIAEPNLYVKIPATAEGIPAVEAMVAEGRNINITLIFSLERYAEVMEAYLTGLEAYDGDLAGVRSVASFFVSRVDTEVDRRLEAIGTEEALALRGTAAVAQAKLAYRDFRHVFTGRRWEALVERGAHLQRPLWASTSTKNPAYSPTLYVDTLIGPDTVNTMPEATLDAVADHGSIAGNTIAGTYDDARKVLDDLNAIGIGYDEVIEVLEKEGVQKFEDSYAQLAESVQGQLDAAS